MEILKTGNRDLMREVNSKLVLEMIKNCSTISQTDLVKKTGLSGGTITSIVKELKERHFVKEMGLGQSLTGKRPVLLQFNPKAQYVIGLELTTQRVSYGLLDLDSHVEIRREEKLPLQETAEATLKAFFSQIDPLLKEVGVTKEQILGIGLAVDGILSADRSAIIWSANLGWKNIPIREIAEKETAITTQVLGTTEAMFLGEYLHGVGKQSQQVVCVQIDAGIGANAILDGHILKGSHAMAGEIGHTLAVPGGLLCRCGKRGCLETIASAVAIVDQVRQTLKAGTSSRLTEIDWETTSLRQAIHTIFIRAQEDDALAREVIRNACYHLGVMIASMINFLDPEMVIVMGMVAYESQGYLLQVLREIVPQYTLENASASVRIEQGLLGENAALIGAAAKVCQEAFRVPIKQPQR